MTRGKSMASMLSSRQMTPGLVVLIMLLSSCGLSSDAWADNQKGAACTPSGRVSGATDNSASDDGNNLVCISGTWQYPAYVPQSATASAGASCTSYPAGAIRYNSTLSNIEMCNGSNWVYLAASAATSCGTPSGPSFTNVTSASLNTVYTSGAATITFTGCTSGGLSVSLSGASTAQISVNGGAWTTAGAISSGQTLQVRLTSSGSASTGLTATVTVGSTSTNWTVTTKAPGSTVFLTPSSYSGNLGGLSGADADCQAAASTAGYAGTYKAIMSDDTTSAASRLTLTYPIVNAYDGTTVAATNLWGFGQDTTTAIKSPTGGTLSGWANAWSGSTNAGQISTGNTCSSWTTASSSVNGNVGAPGNGPAWLGYSSTACNGAPQIYCIKQ